VKEKKSVFSLLQLRRWRLGRG